MLKIKNYKSVKTLKTFNGKNKQKFSFKYILTPNNEFKTIFLFTLQQNPIDLLCKGRANAFVE